MTKLNARENNELYSILFFDYQDTFSDRRCHNVRKRKLAANAMKRAAASAHLPTPWLFESAKRPDDRTDYCLDCSSSPSASTGYSFLHMSGMGRALRANSGEDSAQ